MANSDLAFGALMKPAPGTARLARQVRKLKAKGAVEQSIGAVAAEAARADRAIRFHCFLRDHRRCRAFGMLLKFETDNLQKKAEHHHIILVSAGGSDAPSNRLTLSLKAHRLRHEELLDIEGNADEVVTFTEYTWNTDGSRKLLRRWQSAV